MNRPKLLLVDDSESVLAFERAALAAEYDLEVARDGREALAQVGAHHAAMLLDLTMPVLGGDAVLEALRTTPAVAGVPVLVVSSEHGRRAWSLEAGAVEFLAKPFSADELRAAVRRVVLAGKAKRREQHLAVLPLRAGAAAFAIDASRVRRIAAMVACRPLPQAPAHVLGTFGVEGRTAVAIDAAARLGTFARRPVEEQRIVLVEADGTLVGLVVDEADEPVTVDLDAQLSVGAAGRELPMVRLASGAVALLKPESFASGRFLVAERALVTGAEPT